MTNHETDMYDWNTEYEMTGDRDVELTKLRGQEYHHMRGKNRDSSISDDLNHQAGTTNQHLSRNVTKKEIQSSQA